MNFEGLFKGKGFFKTAEKVDFLSGVRSVTFEKNGVRAEVVAVHDPDVNDPSERRDQWGNYVERWKLHGVLVKCGDATVWLKRDSYKEWSTLSALAEMYEVLKESVEGKLE